MRRRRGEVSNWQLAQARDALELYYEQFHGIALAPRPDDSVAATPPATSSISLETEAGVHEAADGNHKNCPLPFPKPDMRLPAADRNIQNPAVIYHTTGETFKNILRHRSTASEEELEGRPRSPQWNRPARETGSGTGMISPVRAVRPDGGSKAGTQTGKTNWQLLDARVRECLRVAHYSYRTEQTYVGWIRNFVGFHQWQKPSTMDAGHVRDFLRHLAMDRQVAASTQNQALNAVVWLFKSVLKKEIGDFSDFQRARRGLRLPVVAGRAEVKAVIERMSGRERFMAALLYGTGMRINELLSLRVQEVELPCALARKYRNAPWEWRWQYVFAAND